MKRKTKTKVDCIALESFVGKLGVVLIQALEYTVTEDRVKGSNLNLDKFSVKICSRPFKIPYAMT